MGMLRISDGEHRRNVPLGTSNLVGRSWSCYVRFQHPAVPLYWLEVRWYSGTWAWRLLSGAGRTRGAGTSIGDAWRVFAPSGARPARISLAEMLWVELIDSEPPTPFISDVMTGEPVPEAEMTDLVEVRERYLLPLHAEGDERARFAEGEVFRVGDRVLRAHVPQGEFDTEGCRLHLGNPEIEIGIDLEALVARFSDGHLTVEVRGECVRVLAVYAAARVANMPEGGWLTPDEAFAEWSALGGSTTSEPERIAWERARLRTQLSKGGVGGLDGLFELRREGDTARCRLSTSQAFQV